MDDEMSDGLLTDLIEFPPYYYYYYYYDYYYSVLQLPNSQTLLLMGLLGLGGERHSRRILHAACTAAAMQGCHRSISISDL